MNDGKEQSQRNPYEHELFAHSHMYESEDDAERRGIPERPSEEVRNVLTELDEYRQSINSTKFVPRDEIARRIVLEGLRKIAGSSASEEQ